MEKDRLHLLKYLDVTRLSNLSRSYNKTVAYHRGKTFGYQTRQRETIPSTLGIVRRLWPATRRFGTPNKEKRNDWQTSNFKRGWEGGPKSFSGLQLQINEAPTTPTRSTEVTCIHIRSLSGRMCETCERHETSQVQ